MHGVETKSLHLRNLIVGCRPGPFRGGEWPAQGLAIIGHEGRVRGIKFWATALAAGSEINGTYFVEAQKRDDVSRAEVRVRAMPAVYLCPGVEQRGPVRVLPDLVRPLICNARNDHRVRRCRIGA